MGEPLYRRVVVKLSGEYLAGSKPFGIDQATLYRKRKKMGLNKNGNIESQAQVSSV